MGTFLAVSAFRTERFDPVCHEVCRFFSEHGWRADPVSGSDVDPENDILLYEPVADWIVVLWPGYFTELAAAEFASRALAVLASSVRIHDGDYWSHTLFRSGQILDRFASMPDYFTDDPDEIERLSQKWAGNPAVVAQAFGVPEAFVAPYFANLLDGNGLADDVFELDDPWVFVDFWHRLGIAYPADVTNFGEHLRLAPNWLGKLPGGDAEL